MVRHGKTSFQDRWLFDPEVTSWVQKLPNDKYSATCKLCPGVIISVNTMGRQALISHMKSQKHRLKADAKKNQPSLQLFSHNHKTQTPMQVAPVPPPTEEQPVIVNGSIHNLPSKANQPKVSSMSNFVLNSNATKAEIIWTLHSVFSHKTNRATAKDIQILKFMFPDNDIIQKIQLERTKVGYLVVFGLSPFFRKELVDQIKDSGNFVLSFDESLNKVSQSQQMDLVVRFWDKSTNQVTTRYLTSAFLKKSTAADLLTAFIGASNSVELQNLLQVSMDGPNVNKKFLSDLETYLSEDLKTETSMINLGTCGLHTLNCAFKAAINITGWGLIQYLRAVYNFFKNQPARRGGFTRITGSSIFPKKFCEVRWLENEDVAQNAIDMIPNVKKYVCQLDKDKSKPKTKSFAVIEERLKDPLLGAKLAFFKTLATDVKPFLTEFQSNEPLAPFLYTSLKSLVLKEMKRFIIEKEVVASVKALKKENFLAASKVDIGLGAKCQIGKANDSVTTLTVNIFKKECRIALECFVERLLEKSPLQFVTTKLITCLDPSVSYTDIGEKRFEQLAILMTEKNLISTQIAERALEEFKNVGRKSKEIMKKFTRAEPASGKVRNRLDVFWMEILKENDLLNSALEKMLKKVLILSHGNAQVERGFSVNKELLIENMKEESLVASRSVYDAVYFYGGVESVPISNSLILSCKSACSRYKQALEECKKKENEESVAKQNKRRNQILIRELEEKRRKVMGEAMKEVDIIDATISNIANF